jgi:tetratricopeptide (TPR) repeat protein
VSLFSVNGASRGPKKFEIQRSKFETNSNDELRISQRLGFRPGSGLRIFALALFSLGVCLRALAAPDPSSAFDAANKLYYGGKFSEAVAAYENILYSGQKSVALYYNLGNAYFKNGQIGKAIAVYREAEKITPRDPDIRANLQFARNQIQGPTLALGRGQRVLGKLTLNEWTLLAAAALWLCFLILALREWRPTLRRPVRLYLSGAAIATVLLFACVASSWLENRSTRTAIVISRDVPVRRGPLEESAASFTVHDGAELRVLDQNNDWLQVTSDQSRIGWLRRDQVLLSPQT